MTKLRVENVQLNCLVTRLNRQEIINGQKKQTHKSRSTMPPLTSDAMSSNDSKDKRNNATAKLGRQGYLSKEDYQSCRESSQGKQNHLWRDEKWDKGCTEKRMRELEDKLYELEENNKNWRQNLRRQRNQTVSLWKEIFGMQMIGQVRKQTWQIRLWNFAKIFCFLITSSWRMYGRVTNQRKIRASAVFLGKIWQTHTKKWELLRRVQRLRMNGTKFMFQRLVWNTHTWGATLEVTFKHSILVYNKIDLKGVNHTIKSLNRMFNSVYIYIFD